MLSFYKHDYLKVLVMVEKKHNPCSENCCNRVSAYVIQKAIVQILNSRLSLNEITKGWKLNECFRFATQPFDLFQ